MKKIIWLLALGMSAGLAAFAQEERPLSNTDKAFEAPAKSVTMRMRVDLGKGNAMQVEICYQRDLEYARNLDSLVRILMHDITVFKDSLSDELAVRRIDYKITSPDKKQVRIVKYPSAGNSFLLANGGVSALKLEQDTINMILADEKPVADYPKKLIVWKNYCRVSFFINRVEELPEILTTNNLNEKIQALRARRSNWYNEQGTWHLRSDKAITAKQPGGYTINAGDYLNFRTEVALQNYKNYFVPSFRLGAKVALNNAVSMVDKSPRQYQVAFSWEPHFIFQNVQGKLQTFRNDFIELSFGFGPQGGEAEKKSEITQFSLGWLARRQGDYFEKNTFRFGMGRVSLGNNKIFIEPGMYFNNFFRGVTPTMRISF